MRIFLILFLLLALAGAGFGFVLQITETPRNGIVALRWPTSQARNGVSFWVDAQSFPFGESEVLRVVRESFAVWQDVEPSYLKLQDRGIGQFASSVTDRRNLIVYDADGSEFDGPGEAGVLAFTRVNWNAQGALISAAHTLAYRS